MSTKNNVIANVLGRVWGSLMSFAFVPLYVRFMGVEGYGLIGFFTSMLAIFFVLDMGLSVTLNRELARLGPDAADRATARTLVRTLEIIYWIIGVVVCAFIVAAAPAIATRWLNVKQLPLAEAVGAVRLMGLVAMFRWPVALYSGALMGLRRQVLLNVVTSLMTTLQGGGAVLILWLVTPTVTAFFTWQAFTAFIQIAILVAVTWRNIPLEHHRARFGRAVLRSIAGFSAGITGITLLSAIMSQLDKFALSRMLPLEEFGYYSMAAAIGGLLVPAGGAVYSAVFPVFAAMVANARHDELERLYHKSCELLAVMIIPAATVIAFFSTDLLTVYLRDPRVVQGVSLLLTLQIIGNCFLTLMLLPLGLQLAFGWTKLSVYKNVVAVILYVPLLFLMVSRFGAPGAAALWIMVTFGYFLFEVQIMHRRILRGHQWRWYFIDTGVPATVSIFVVGLARLVVGPAMPVLPRLLVIVAAGAASLGISTVLLPGTRALLTSTLAGIGARMRVLTSRRGPAA